jgi:hypothetical protein
MRPPPHTVSESASKYPLLKIIQFCEPRKKHNSGCIIRCIYSINDMNMNPRMLTNVVNWTVSGMCDWYSRRSQEHVMRYRVTPVISFQVYFNS